MGLLLTVVLLVGDPVLPYALGHNVGEFIVATPLAALATWLTTRRNACWAFWKLAALTLPFFILVSFLFAAVTMVGTAQN